MPPITTPQQNFRKVTAASVPSAYDAPAAVLTFTEPSTSVLFNLTSASVSGENPSLLHLLPFIIAAGSPPTNTGMGMRIIGWRKYLSTDGATFWYMPNVLADLTLAFTSGTVPGYTIDGVANTRTFSSAVQVAGTPTAYLYSPATAAAANVEPATVIVDITGSQIVTAQFKSSGTPTMGAFWATL
jgi:hypothetical protein